MKYKQLKDLPFSKAGSIWEIEGNDIKVNGCICNINPYLAITEYYTQESGEINLDDQVWFELAGSEEEKKLQRIKEIQNLEAGKEIYQEKINEINRSLELLKD